MNRILPLVIACAVCAIALSVPASGQDASMTPFRTTAASERMPAFGTLARLAPSPAPQEEDQDLYKDRGTLWAVGLQGGLLSGMGVGVRMNYAQRFGFQLAGGALTLSDKLLYSVGFEGQFDLDVRKRSRLYALAGLGYYNNGEKEPVADSTGKKPEDKRLDGPFRAGLGVGYEWAISDKMVFMVTAAFTYFSDGQFLPLPQVGVFYYFR